MFPVQHQRDFFKRSRFSRSTLVGVMKLELYGVFLSVKMNGSRLVVVFSSYEACLLLLSKPTGNMSLITASIFDSCGKLHRPVTEQKRVGYVDSQQFYQESIFHSILFQRKHSGFALE